MKKSRGQAASKNAILLVLRWAMLALSSTVLTVRQSGYLLKILRSVLFCAFQNCKRPEVHTCFIYVNGLRPLPLAPGPGKLH
eukprot:12429991-Karenia_brevis.AAC.1